MDDPAPNEPEFSPPAPNEPEPSQSDAGQPSTGLPDTLILVHRRERPHKCTVEPLRGRDGFQFHTYPYPLEQSLDGFVRLGLGGPMLSPADATSGLLVLDATWRLAKKMESVCRDVPVRSIPTVETAYPRVSRFNDDPHGGLATIEAIYVAYRLLGRDTTGLLDEYHWANEFLSRNGYSTPN